MLVSIKWSLENLSKAFRIHHFEGNREQFKQVLELAQKEGIEYTRDIPDSMI